MNLREFSSLFKWFLIFYTRIRKNQCDLPDMFEPLHTLLFRVVSSCFSLSLSSAKIFLSSGRSSLSLRFAYPKQTITNTNSRYIGLCPCSSPIVAVDASVTTDWTILPFWPIFSFIFCRSLVSQTCNVVLLVVSHFMINISDRNRFCFDDSSFMKWICTDFLWQYGSPST